MSFNMYYKQYRENSIYTSSPEELTYMLYNGLVIFIIKAQEAVKEKNMEKAHNYIVKAKKILLNFENTLDMKYEISKDLMKMYEYMYKRLTDANIKKDINILEEILGYAKEIRATWYKVMEIAKHRDKR